MSVSVSNQLLWGQFPGLYSRVLGPRLETYGGLMALFEDKEIDGHDRNCIREQLIAEAWGYAEPV